MDYVLQTDNLTKKYRRFPALNELTMHVPKGSIYGLVGKNGAGKTTLMRVVCGLQEPTSGSYTLYQQAHNSRSIAGSRRRIGAVVETPSIFLNMTAEDNLKQQSMILGLPSYDEIPELLKLVGLENTGKKKVRSFFRYAAAGFLLLITYCKAITAATTARPAMSVQVEGASSSRPPAMAKMRVYQGMELKVKPARPEATP